MNQTAFRVRLVNRGPACSLRGYPQRMAGTTITGKTRRLRVSPEPREDERALTSRQPAGLATGDVAEFVLHAGYSCMHPQGDDHRGHTYRRLRFGLPHVAGHVTVTFSPRSDPKMDGMWLPGCSTSVTGFHGAIPFSNLFPKSSKTSPGAGASSYDHPASKCTVKAWPYPTPILDLQFVGDAGWAVGATGVLATSDGGAHWTRQLHTARHDLGSVDFVDADHGWAVGTSRLLFTVDGGAHWRRLPEPGCRRIRMVHFISPTRGFAVAGGSTDGRPGALPTSGGVLLATRELGRSWTRLPAPPDAQSVCFQDRHTGWIGTAHGIYATTDSGRHWRRIVAAPGGRLGAQPTVSVRCAGHGIAWALAAGPGAASSQMPHLGWRLTTTSGTPLFAEQYFPHPAVTVNRQSPGSYPGPFSPIDQATAAFIDNCSACGPGAVPWLLASHGGTALHRRGNVTGLSNATAAAFTTRHTGCIAGTFRRVHHDRVTAPVARIVCTHDSGAPWRITWHHHPPHQG